MGEAIQVLKTQDHSEEQILFGVKEILDLIFYLYNIFASYYAKFLSSTIWFNPYNPPVE
jgi:hypothetical protein